MSSPSRVRPGARSSLTNCRRVCGNPSLTVGALIGYTALHFYVAHPPTAAHLFSGGTVDAVTDLRDGERAQHDGDLPHVVLYAFDGLGRRELATLGGDQHAGGEHYTQECGVDGWRWAAIPASMSRAKSSSMTAFDPRTFNSAITSEIGRPISIDGLITAMGRWLCSICLLYTSPS